METTDKCNGENGATDEMIAGEMQRIARDTTDAMLDGFVTNTYKKAEDMHRLLRAAAALYKSVRNGIDFTHDGTPVIETGVRGIVAAVEAFELAALLCVKDDNNGNGHFVITKEV